MVVAHLHRGREQRKPPLPVDGPLDVGGQGTGHALALACKAACGGNPRPGRTWNDILMAMAMPDYSTLSEPPVPKPRPS